MIEFAAALDRARLAPLLPARQRSIIVLLFAGDLGRGRMGGGGLLLLQGGAMSFSECRNQILRGLSRADRALLASGLEEIELEFRQAIKQANTPIDHVYFPDNCIIISVVVKSAGDQIEVGLIGREGMSGIAIGLGDERSPHDAYVQMAGAPIASLQSAFARL